MRGRKLVWVALMYALAAPPAVADSNSPWTLGAGSGVGYRIGEQPEQLGTATLVTQVAVRMKALWVLGVDYAYDLSYDQPDAVTRGERPQYGSRMRLTGLLYAVPDDKASLYLGVGVGGNTVSGLFDAESRGSSYHAGVGLEVYLSDHIAFDASFYLLAPGIASVDHYARYTSARDAGREAGTLDAGGDVPARKRAVGDFVSHRSHELMMRILVYL